MRSRLGAGVAVCAVVGLLTACGGGSDAAGPSSSSTTPSSTTTTSPPSTTTTTATPTAPPLSPFEDKASVVALRAWALAVAQSTTANDKAMKAVVPLATAAGLADSKIASESDMGLVYPGPLPFTPTTVTESGSIANIKACVQAGGWGLDPKTKLPTGSRSIIAADFGLKLTGGAWKLNSVVEGSHSCAKVVVKGVAS